VAHLGEAISVHVVFVAGEVREVVVTYFMVEIGNLPAGTAQVFVPLGDVFSSLARRAPRFYVT
jgi:hypothetical protein